ncbi:MULTISPECIES: hypothetical protein [unclassified Rhizobium]|jgi:hypothetical protein|uniref:hypothetical protein n=1 Tax=unclassified Rhizobium TaxID=2613769 RepID=UPI003D294E37
MKDLPIQDFATALEAMTEDEVFLTMSELEKRSEAVDGEARDEVFARIALVETAIEDRYPGQAMSPYRSWKQRQPLL